MHTCVRGSMPSLSICRAAQLRSGLGATATDLISGASPTHNAKLLHSSNATAPAQVHCKAMAPVLSNCISSVALLGDIDSLKVVAV